VASVGPLGQDAGVTTLTLHQALHQQVDSGALPGAVALVARGDDEQVVAVGRRAVDGPAMTRDSIFRIASITKPITAVATMMLVERGLLGLDDPVDRFLPELAGPQVLRTPAGPVDDTVPAVRPITTRHLLTFTAGHGFPADFGLPVVQLLFGTLGQGPPNPQGPPTPDAWMQLLAGIPLLHQPGEGWTYNTGSDVLGVLIARASGRSLPEFLGEEIFGPLGMRDTGFWVPAADLPRFTGYYRRDPQTGGLTSVDEPSGQWASAPAFPSGAGGLVSTVDDWLAFGRMLLAGGSHAGARLLVEASVRQLMTDHTDAAMREAGRIFLDGQGWGFGGSVDIAATEPWTVPGRYGWVGGTGTAAHVTPDGTVTLLMTQVELSGPHTPPVMRDFWTAAAR
jgi:CubicO group peptidase (beta-lactamase class C family)